MLGIALSLIASLPVSAMPAEATCAAQVDVGDLAETGADGAGATLLETVSDGAEPVRYATPAAIDCRVPVVTPVLLALVGECAGVTVADASYRASRLPESEAPAGSLSPARTDASSKLRVTVCSGIPSQPGTSLSPPPGQPLALFALPDFPRLPQWRAVFTDDSLPRSPQLHRLERPPRV